MPHRIGITGQAGFIGTHLFNYFSLDKEKYATISFEDSFFYDENALDEFVKQCDTIIHLAAMNRHEDENVIYETNINLVDRLIASLKRTGSSPKILFSSSTQEERDNLYGRSKRIGREKLIEWAEENDASFTGMIIPNVFGPFGRPFYNSFIATFCHQLVNNETPKVMVDSEVKLIFVDDLVREIENIILNKHGINKELFIPVYYEEKVTTILSILERFKTEYFDYGIIPEIKTRLELNLLNMLRSYINHKEYFPRKYKVNADDRGIFVELIRLNTGGQVSYSTTKPGIVRGNHFHTRKVERFSVIKGKAKIELRKIGTDEVLEFILNGEEPGYVDMPIWYTHNISNIGEDELLTVFWINEMYNPKDPDTFFEKV